MTSHEKTLAKMRNNPRDWRIDDLKAVANRLGGASKNRSERAERKADGAQEARHIKMIGELSSTAQRSDRSAQ